MKVDLLRDIVQRLDKQEQAATYGAVAGLVGESHRTVMASEPRDHRNIWVINERTKEPTGYGAHQIHPGLRAAIASRGVIETPEDLDDWLTSHP